MSWLAISTSTLITYSYLWLLGVFLSTSLQLESAQTYGKCYLPWSWALMILYCMESQWWALPPSFPLAFKQIRSLGNIDFTAFQRDFTDPPPSSWWVGCVLLEDTAPGQGVLLSCCTWWCEDAGPRDDKRLLETKCSSSPSLLYRVASIMFTVLRFIF